MIRRITKLKKLDNELKEQALRNQPYSTLNG